LEDIGANHIPTLAVLNKKDLISSNELKEKTVDLQPVIQDFVVISALREENLDSLESAVIKRLPHHLHLRLILPTNDEASHFLSWLYDRAKVSEVTTKEDRMSIDLEAPQRFLGKIQGYVSRLNGEIRTNDYTRVESG
jgi:50S ribosomal subunit-associated GTPase HflX